MRRRYFLADQSLSSYSGHCFGYLSSLAQVLQAHGHETVMLGNRSASKDFQTAHGIVPAFTYQCDDRLASRPKTRRAHEKDVRTGLREVAHAQNVTGADVFFINTLRHWAIRGVVDWLEELPAERRPNVVLVFHFTGCPEGDVFNQASDYYRDAFDRIQKSPACGRIHLFADTEELIDEYRELSPHLRFQLAPVPHIRKPSTERKQSAGGKWRLGYAGEARRNKGFDLVPYLAERLEQEGLAAEIELHVQTFCGNTGWDFFPRSIARLNQSFVTAYPDAMDEDAYYRFIEALDLMLIPYTRDNYRSQTSGIFAEAMAYGQVVVAPRGTWMARQLKQFGGGRTFIPDDGLDLADQVCHILRHRDAYRAEALGRVEAWSRFHNPHCLVDLIENCAV